MSENAGCATVLAVFIVALAAVIAVVSYSENRWKTACVESGKELINNGWTGPQCRLPVK